MARMDTSDLIDLKLALQRYSAENTALKAELVMLKEATSRSRAQRDNDYILANHEFRETVNRLTMPAYVYTAVSSALSPDANDAERAMALGMFNEWHVRQREPGPTGTTVIRRI
jgi:hypothetical protein